ncbi:MAG: SCO family protein [Gammaproteobacteria bacterium]|nr:SCO family protein [Gammaproteobacteria bacterium]MCB1905024.1 SCO family protein [Gammaproteobacteria bacterium]
MRHLLALLLVVFSAAPPHFVSANEGGTSGPDSVKNFQYKTALQSSQAAIGRKLDDYLFTDQNGRSIRVSDFHGKPLVLSLIYTSCYHICPMTTRHLSKVVEKAREALGHDSFSVAVLGFDAQHDTPQAMISYAKKQGIANAEWFLLSADSDTVNALSKQLGFLFFTSPNGFDHIVQASVIDADRIVYTQVYGEVFETPLLVEPLKDLVLGRPKPGQSFFEELVDKVRFFCTAYDPSRDGYQFDYSLFIGLVIGAMIILSGLLFVFFELLKKRRLD